MNLEQRIADRGITEAIHFTTNRGLIGALHTQSLLSRPLLKEDEYLRHVLQLNAATRPEESALFDKTSDWIRFVNLTISEVNSRFLEISRRWHTNSDVWWCILAFDAKIMNHGGVWFTTTNNGYDRCQRGNGKAGFDALFEARIERKERGATGTPWNVLRNSRAPHLTTCEQAEILYPEKLSLEYLRTVYVEEDEHHDRVVGWLENFGPTGVKVIVNKEKFAGRRN